MSKNSRQSCRFGNKDLLFDENDDKKDQKEAVVIKKKQEVDALTPLQPKHKKKRC